MESAKFKAQFEFIILDLVGLIEVYSTPRKKTDENVFPVLT